MEKRLKLKHSHRINKIKVMKLQHLLKNNKKRHHNSNQNNIQTQKRTRSYLANQHLINITQEIISKLKQIILIKLLQRNNRKSNNQRTHKQKIIIMRLTKNQQLRINQKIRISKIQNNYLSHLNHLIQIMTNVRNKSKIIKKQFQIKHKAMNIVMTS